MTAAERVCVVGIGTYLFDMAGWISSWRKRHQHAVSLGLHLIAIPLLPWAGWLAVVQMIDGAWALWWRPVGLIVLSYLLQWIGHKIEGNDMGELILVKRVLGKPYVAVSPRYSRLNSA